MGPAEEVKALVRGMLVLVRGVEAEDPTAREVEEEAESAIEGFFEMRGRLERTLEVA